MKIGLLLIATNKYFSFLQPLIYSADEFFLNEKELEVEYFIFTDKQQHLHSNRKISVITTEHKPWPAMTLHRYDLFFKQKELLKKNDYLFYCDADMLFVSKVGDEILSDRVATIHPGFIGGRGTPETDERSLAFISEDEEMQYFAGGFNGGSAVEFLNMSEKISINVNDDLRRGIIALWHDESHLNRYFIDNKPTLILDPSYCCPENSKTIDNPKLLALFKKHADYR